MTAVEREVVSRAPMVAGLEDDGTEVLPSRKEASA